MGLKLGLSTPAAHARAAAAAGEPQLRNVRIDALWQRAQAEGVPPAEWRAYVRRELVRRSDGPPLGGAEGLRRALGASLGKLGDSLGGEINKLGGEISKLGGEMNRLGDRLGENVGQLFAGDPSPPATAGGKAGGARP